MMILLCPCIVLTDREIVRQTTSTGHDTYVILIRTGQAHQTAEPTVLWMLQHKDMIPTLRIGDFRTLMRRSKIDLKTHSSLRTRDPEVEQDIASVSSLLTSI